MAALFGKGTERSWSGLLLPNGSALARWCERDPQVLLVPVPQRFGIMRGLAGCAEFCAAMANSFRRRMKLDPKA